MLLFAAILASLAHSALTVHRVLLGTYPRYMMVTTRAVEAAQTVHRTFDHFILQPYDFEGGEEDPASDAEICEDSASESERESDAAEDSASDAESEAESEAEPEAESEAESGEISEDSAGEPSAPASSSSWFW